MSSDTDTKTKFNLKITDEETIMNFNIPKGAMELYKKACEEDGVEFFPLNIALQQLMECLMKAILPEIEKTGARSMAFLNQTVAEAIKAYDYYFFLKERQISASSNKLQ